MSERLQQLGGKGAAQSALRAMQEEEAGSKDAQAGYLQSLAGAGQDYTVMPGDTLGKIARATLGDPKRWREIAEHNGVNPNRIRVGQVLQIPRGARGPSKGSLLPPGSVSSSSCAEFTKGWEGFEARAYWDVKQWSVGYGTHIDDQTTANYGVTKDSTIDEALGVKMLTADIQGALGRAKEVFASFDEQPTEVQLILVDLTYNLGDHGVTRFRRFIKAIEQKSYAGAALELATSSWYGQVGRRGKNHVHTLRELGRP